MGRTRDQDQPLHERIAELDVKALAAAEKYTHCQKQFDEMFEEMYLKRKFNKKEKSDPKQQIFALNKNQEVADHARVKTIVNSNKKMLEKKKRRKQRQSCDLLDFANAVCDSCRARCCNKDGVRISDSRMCTVCKKFYCPACKRKNLTRQNKGYIYKHPQCAGCKSECVYPYSAIRAQDKTDAAEKLFTELERTVQNFAGVHSDYSLVTGIHLYNSK